MHNKELYDLFSFALQSQDVLLEWKNQVDSTDPLILLKSLSIFTPVDNLRYSASDTLNNLTLKTIKYWFWNNSISIFSVNSFIEAICTEFGQIWLILEQFNLTPKRRCKISLSVYVGI